MSDEKIRRAARTGERLRALRCTTPGHEDRPAGWLIDRDPPGIGKRWVCEECRDTAASLHTG